MKKILALVLLVVLGTTLFAYPGISGHLTQVDPELILSAAPSISDKTILELTLEEHLAIRSALSIAKQEQRYVKAAAFSSFLVPGTGQLMTGYYGEAAAFIGIQTLITAATFGGLYFLAPAELKDFSLTYQELRENHKHYYENLTPQEVWPVLGVMTGGMLLTTVNRIISANRAEQSAMNNIASGKVSFEPLISTSFGGELTFGMRMKM